MSAFLSPVEPAVQDISPASHVPLPWRFGEPRADAGAKGSHVATYATWKNPLSKHAAPALRRGDRMPLRGKAREGRSHPCGKKRVKVRSHLTPLHGKSV